MQSVTVEVHVTPEQIANLLVSAFEGGSNYWYEITKFGKPKVFDTFCGLTLAQLQKTGEVAGNKGPKIFPHVDYPMSTGGYLLIKQTVDEGGPGVRKFTWTSIARGLRDMAASETYQHHFLDILKDETDATTADVFLQFCLYSDVLFG